MKDWIWGLFEFEGIWIWSFSPILQEKIKKTENLPEILETFFESEKKFSKIINKKAVPKISEFPKISTPFLASWKCAFYLGTVF